MALAFVTGATGLLGNNLVRALVAQGWRVRALSRSAEKARSQLGDVAGVEFVIGDMSDVDGFATALSGVDTLFHTAAYFRDSYTGGSHAAALTATNVDGVRALMAAAYAQGVRRMVQTSSIAVLDGAPGQPIDETCLRAPKDADDYYRSKIDADEEVFAFLRAHPDFHASFVLPGWMHGPGDAGPTSAGQVTLDFLNRRLPGSTPATFAVVDARDVAQALIAADAKGRRGERYLAAGRHMTMPELYAVYEQVSGVKAPKGKLPGALLMAVATAQELGARFTRKPILLSLATVKLMLREAGRTHFNHAKSERELGLTFRPVAETLRDEVAWYRAHGWLGDARRAA